MPHPSRERAPRSLSRWLRDLTPAPIALVILITAMSCSESPVESGAPGDDPAAGDASAAAGDAPLPPAPEPAAETVLYAEDFEGPNPFAGWLGRNRDRNLKVITEGSNHHGRLIYVPLSDWRVSFRDRHHGVFDVHVEFSLRFPKGYRYKRYPAGGPRAGEVVGAGKHVWMLTSSNQFAESRQEIAADGVTRLDFSSPTELGPWACVSYRNRPGGSRPGEFKKRLKSGEWFVPGRWHRVRCDLHLNPGPGDASGTVGLSIDGDPKGTFGGEFNVIGEQGGVRVLGFGDMDNLEGEPWMDIDDIRVETPGSRAAPVDRPGRRGESALP